MASNEDRIDIEEFRAATRSGEDTTPLMALVPEAPPSHWGKITSTPRTASPQYLAFLARHKEVQGGRKQQP